MCIDQGSQGKSCPSDVLALATLGDTTQIEIILLCCIDQGSQGKYCPSDVFALATLGDMTQIEIILFVLH